MHRFTLLAPAVALIATSASAQIGTTFTHVATIDISSASEPLNAEFIGWHPSAVAWDGARLFVAGFNDSGASGMVAIVEIVNPLSGSPSYGTRFGVRGLPPELPTPNNAGYSGLDIHSDRILAAYDFGGLHAKGLTTYTYAGSEQWAYTMRGSSGVGFDPGYFAAGTGVGWTTLDQGRRALNDLTNGAMIYTLANGIDLTGAGTGKSWRDMDFDDDTGDIWLREGNNVIRVPRTGANSGATALLVRDEPEADVIVGQNLAYLDVSCCCDRVIYNERDSTAAAQSFFDVVKVCSAGGVLLYPDWGSLSPSHGNGWYDFSWDEATRRLAILDSWNKSVYVLELEADAAIVAPSTYCTSGTSSHGCNALMGWSGTPSASKATAFTVNVSNVEGAKYCLFFYGLSPAATQWNNNGSYLCVKSPLIRTGVQPLNGTANQCNGSYALDWYSWWTAAGAPYLCGKTYYAQAWYRDPPAHKATNMSDGLKFTLYP